MKLQITNIVNVVYITATKKNMTSRIEPNEITYADMEAAENDEDMHGPFDSVADMMDALNA